LIEAGASSLVVADVDASRRDDLVQRLAPRGVAVASAAIADAAGCQIIVNATPVGMKPADPLPVDIARIDANAVVGDLITKPVVTPLLEAARQRGCTVVTGEDMFAVQAGYMADILLAPR
jgi:shikimate dehydrogenase